MEAFKIFHISDVHIGMKFQRYPEIVRDRLIDARFESVRKAVSIANEKGCHVLAIAGDLFESIKVKQKDVFKTVELLNCFQGDHIWVLPGNHDYYDPSLKLWHWFMEKASDKITLLSENKVYRFEHDNQEINVFAAPCDQKHSSENNLEWIKKTDQEVSGIRLLLAHGAIKEISPDLNNTYFPMTLPELKSLKMTACLLGHTHVPYPLHDRVQSESVFNAGTSEPDGLNYKYEGAGWYMEIKSDRAVYAEKTRTGRFVFKDLTVELEDEVDLDRVREAVSGEDGSNLIARVNLRGYLNQEAFDTRFNMYEVMKKDFFYLDILDHDLKPKFSRAVIEKTFSENSVPYLLLEQLLDRFDEETAHMAFDMMMEGMKK